MRRRRSTPPILLAAVFGFAPAQNVSPRACGLLDRVPAAFVPNLGQWENPARFVARIGPMTAFLEDAGWTLSVGEALEAETVRGAAVRMRFVGGGGSPEVVAEGPLAGVHNYFLGNDPARWRTGVERFARVRYRGLYPGVDVVCYEKEGRLEYDPLLEPGADLAGIEVEVEGAEGLRLEPDGALVLDTAAGPLRQEPPVTYEVDSEGRRRALASRHELRRGDRFGFVVPEWRGGNVLVLDPGIQWSTFVGTPNLEIALGLSVDTSGVVTITGITPSGNYPTTPGAWNTAYGGAGDSFVTRLDMFPTGASPYGSSTPGCAGPLPIGVTSMPQVGNATFAIRSTNAPPNTTGVLAFSSAGLANPYTLGPLAVWVDPASPAFFGVLVSSNGTGKASFALPILTNPALVGAQAFTQFLWLGPSSPPPCPATGVSASNALEITIQP